MKKLLDEKAERGKYQHTMLYNNKVIHSTGDLALFIARESLQLARRDEASTAREYRNKYCIIIRGRPSRFGCCCYCCCSEREDIV